MDVDRYLKTGLFLPVANHNWVMATSGPEDPATFAFNLALTQRGERMGMDLVLAQSVWRGHGGATRFWDDSLESFTITAGLAARTERIGIITTVMPLLYPPVVAAKMIATLDEISQGRVMMNLVVGANMREYEQMGVLPGDWPAVKYAYAAEWLQLVKRLWTEERVTHQGRWFDLVNCVCGPKPLQRPTPDVLCAGSSPAGKEFTSSEATHGFVGGSDPAAVGELAHAYKAAAADKGRALELISVMMLVLAPTLAEAEDRIAAYEAEPDVAAIRDHHGEYTRPDAGASLRRDGEDAPLVWFGERPEPLTPALLVERLHALYEAGVDGMLFTAADWAHDLDVVERDVFPELRRRGIVAPLLREAA